MHTMSEIIFHYTPKRYIYAYHIRKLYFIILQRGIHMHTMSEIIFHYTPKRHISAYHIRNYISLYSKEVYTCIPYQKLYFIKLQRGIYVHTISEIIWESRFPYFSAGPACYGNQYPPFGCFF